MLYGFNKQDGLHHPPPGSSTHVEVPARTRRIHDHLTAQGLLARVTRVPSLIVTEAMLCRAHSPEHAHNLVSGSLVQHDDDTYVNAASARVALEAAGIVLNMTVALLSNNQATCGFANVRPPGHHATRARHQGFCLINNVAMAATCAMEQGWRVAVVDWDVHHGNGTEAIMAGRANGTFVSVHRYGDGFYPRTGPPGSRGNISNINLRGGTDSEFRAHIDTVAGSLREWKPDIVIVSCGFDACQGDPLGEQHVSPGTFGECTTKLQSVSPRLLLVLEGGYSLEQLPKCAESCVRALLH